MRHRIAQIGTFDLDNFGDLLFPQIFREILNHILGENNFELICFSPKGSASGLIYEDQICATPIRDFEAIHQQLPFDHVFIGGGDLLRSDDWSLADIYNDISHCSFTRLLSPNADNRLNIHLLAIGAPFPFDDEFKIFLQNTLSRSRISSVRDKITWERLLQLNIQSEFIPDIALSVEELWPINTLPPLSNFLPGMKEGSYFIFQGSTHVIPSSHYDNLAKLLFKIENEFLITPVLLQIGGPLGDAALFDILQPKLRELGSRAIRLRTQTIKEMVSALAHSSCYIGSSMHGSIVSYAYCRPVISYVGEHLIKIMQLFKDVISGVLFKNFEDLLNNLNLKSKFDTDDKTHPEATIPEYPSFESILKTQSNQKLHPNFPSGYLSVIQNFIERALKTPVSLEEGSSANQSVNQANSYDQRISTLYLGNQQKLTEAIILSKRTHVMELKKFDSKVKEKQSQIDNLSSQIEMSTAATHSAKKNPVQQLSEIFKNKSSKDYNIAKKFY